MSNFQDFFIQWHLTERCNLSCAHCYQTGGKTEELSLAEIGIVLEEIEDMLKAWGDMYQLEFSPSFNITGGEPLLRKDLFEILAKFSSSNFGIFLLTNGTMVNPKNAKQLAILGLNGVQVSIEGPEEIHDAIRGRGSFSAACRGVECLLKAGLQVTLNTTLSEINIEKLSKMVEIANFLGAHRLGFSRLVPAGKGLGMVGRMLSKEKVKDIYKSIFSHPRGHLDIVTGDPIASQMRGADGEDDHGSHPYGGCSAGIAGLTILPDGTVTPCRRLALPLGNVRKDSLREIWANSDILEQLRDRSQYKGKCGVCSRWAVCRGCRAIAYAFSLTKGAGDFLAEDPQCFVNGA